mgnify:CR=1 FL=1
MIEELPDDIAIDDDLDDVEPVGDEAQLYEHFRVVVDRGCLLYTSPSPRD